jgi:hypothetical protein
MQSGNNNRKNKEEKKVSFLEVERFLANDLSELEKKSFEKRLADDEELQKYMQEVKEQRTSLSFNAVRNRVEQQHALKGSETESLSILVSLVDMFNRFTRKPALAYAAVAVLIISFSAVFMVQKGTNKGPGFMSKGDTGIKLICGERTLQKGSRNPVKPGDTLSFSYRGPDPLFLQVWYQDDDGQYFAYLENSGEALLVEASMKWNALPEKVVLDSDWSKEKVFLIYSDSEFSSGDAVELLQTGKSAKILEIDTFVLTNVFIKKNREKR